MAKLDPTTDPRLNPAEQALYSRVYPLLLQIEEELQTDITRLTAVNMVRRAVSRGANADDLLEELRAHAEHQTLYNHRTSTSH